MRIALGEDRIEGLVRQLGNGGDRPGPDPRRESQQGAAMGHVGEAEAAIAIGIERIASRQEAIVEATIAHGPTPLRRPCPPAP